MVKQNRYLKNFMLQISAVFLISYEGEIFILSLFIIF